MKYLSALSFFLAYYSLSMSIGFIWVLLSFSNARSMDGGYGLVDLLIAGHVAALIVGLPISTIVAVKLRKSISPFRRNIIITHPPKCRLILYRILIPDGLVLAIFAYYFKHPLPLMFLSCVSYVVFLSVKGFIDWNRI